MKLMWRSPVVSMLASVILLGVVGASPTVAQTGSLAGEIFYSPFSEVQVTAECDEAGTSTIRFDVTGVAEGPYPGTFEAQGTLTIGPTTPGRFWPTGEVLTFEESFRIFSGDTVITGTKRFVASFRTGGSCHDVTEPFETPEQLVRVSGHQYAGNVLVEYDATIQTPTGTSTDEGTAQMHVSEAFVCEETLDGEPWGCSGGANFDQLFLESSNPPLGPTAVVLDPAAATNEVGTAHTVTATATTATGSPSPGVAIVFAVSGSTTASGSCTTDANGQCSFTYTGPQLPGADLIVGCSDTNSNGTQDAGEPCGEALKAWILPASTPGQVTGGGYILDPADNEKVSFGFNALSTANGIKGNCTVVDAAPARNVKIKCLTVTSLVQTATHATFFGQAEVNGVLTDYRIDVDDNAEPGRGTDTFKIVTSSGYSAAGILDGGNIQVHRAE